MLILKCRRGFPVLGVQRGLTLVFPELIDCSLNGSEGQGRTANAALDDIRAHFVDHRVGAEFLDLIQAEPLDELGDDRPASLADRASFALEADGFDTVVVPDLQIHGDQIATARISAAELDVSVFHPMTMARVFEVIEQDFNILLSVHGDFCLQGSQRDRCEK